ncbi:MAG: hypothetical protein MZU95_13360 [Desulfomicrobium escambiense]|nr:hypothetical protein [Desulfomicrobium escambiense]
MELKKGRGERRGGRSNAQVHGLCGAGTGGSERQKVRGRDHRAARMIQRIPPRADR